MIPSTGIRMIKNVKDKPSALSYDAVSGLRTAGRATNINKRDLPDRKPPAT